MESGKRKSIRLKGYDYSQAGFYFVTICIHQGRHLLGKVANAEMVRSPAGHMVQETWSNLEERFPFSRNDSFVAMPNHCHGILQFDPQTIAVPVTLGKVIGAFKSLTTNIYCDGVSKQDWPRFDGRLWHRNYFERMIRNEKELNEIRRYIFENPARWHADRFNPEATEIDRYDSDFS